ncbi:MAG: LysE family translocator [Pseudomonadota bacterium]
MDVVFPVDPLVLATFVATCWLLAWTPGPAMALIIANTTTRGFWAGFYTLLGTGTGLAFMVCAAALGMTSLMVFMAAWFDVVRWVGALYLVWLGALAIRRAWRGDVALEKATPTRGRSLFVQGIIVAMANPKVLLFLGAFLPQFVDAASPAGPQLAVLAVAFVVTMFLADLAYTVALARLTPVLAGGRMRLVEGASGALLIAAGAVVAVARRP